MLEKKRMNSLDLLQQTVDQVLDCVGRETLRDLTFSPLGGHELDWHLARLSHAAAPAYLPFADHDAGVLALHLHPARPMDQSPIVHVDPETQKVRFVCADLTHLPTGLWLWIARYFKDRPDDLRQATAMLAANIPGARPVPEPLWSILAHSPAYEPTWWNARCSSYTRSAWDHGDVGHPFVGIPDLEWDAPPAEAIRILDPFVRAHPHPESLDLIVAAQSRAGDTPSATDVIAILEAEAWLGGEPLLEGLWRRIAKGLRIWDSTLRHLPERTQLLADTPFAILADHPDTYGGDDPQGVSTLAFVAERLCDGGDYLAALNQIRNAWTVSAIIRGDCSQTLALEAAAVCDTIAPNSVAAALSRRVSEIDLTDL